MSQVDYIPEKDLSGHSKAISIEEFEKLNEFARKRICKIKWRWKLWNWIFLCDLFR